MAASSSQKLDAFFESPGESRSRIRASGRTSKGLSGAMRKNRETIAPIDAENKQHLRVQRYHEFLDTLSDGDGIHRSADARFLGMLIGEVSEEAFDRSLSQLRQIIARHIKS